MCMHACWAHNSRAAAENWRQSCSPELRCVRLQYQPLLLPTGAFLSLAAGKHYDPEEDEAQERLQTLARLEEQAVTVQAVERV